MSAGEQVTAIRVSDAERDRVARLLADAHGEGRLTLGEFDERVRAAHGAVVRADLDPLLADLPAGRETAVAGRRPAPGRDHRPSASPFLPPVAVGGPCGRGGLRGAVAAWVVASVVNLVIWFAVSLGSAGSVYPWWIWVAGPWGLALLLGAGVHRAVRSS